MRFLILLAFALAGGAAAAREKPEALTADGIPPLPPGIEAGAARYLEFRTARFNEWHPDRREMLISTRFGDAAQLHAVKMPGGARRQLTFQPEPVSGGTWEPGGGGIIFSSDAGGSEFYQLYRFDTAAGLPQLLTDGKSRNAFGRWSPDGKRIAYTSTRRTGGNSDIWITEPANPKADRMVLQRDTPGWSVSDWSPDGAKLLLARTLSAEESTLHLLDLASGESREITPAGPAAAWSQARFAGGSDAFFALTDQGEEFERLVRIDLKTGARRPYLADLKWGVEEWEPTDDRKTLACAVNEDGAARLWIVNAEDGTARKVDGLPTGVISGLDWRADGSELGFTFSGARAAADAFSWELTTGKLHRWTESETGGLPTETFSEAQLIRFPSFDQRTISAFVYKPAPDRWKGKRPVVISIHGGPEGQSRPGFLGRNNYLINELGCTLIYPNVRGSTGYGRTFLGLDNGRKREDSVKDIGALLDWIAAQPDLDAERVAVMGGSYGGYMTLASLVHYSDRLRCGVDSVGISNFVTFLKNTQGYRRNQRRAEYGDESDPEMAAFLEGIAPLNQVEKITKPLMIVQGANDPRVPASEAEQMVKALRAKSGTVWYLLAGDEGHGFQKKPNADWMFLAQLFFFRENLLQ